MSSPHKDEALQSQPMEQVEGSSQPMEQDQEVTLGSTHPTKQVEMAKHQDRHTNKKLAMTWSL